MCFPLTNRATLILLFSLSILLAIAVVGHSRCDKPLSAKLHLGDGNNIVTFNIDISAESIDNVQPYYKSEYMLHPFSLFEAEQQMKQAYYSCLRDLGSHGGVEGYLVLDYHHAIGITNQIMTVTQAALAARLLNFTLVVPTMQSETKYVNANGVSGLSASPVAFDRYFDSDAFSEGMAKHGIRARTSLPRGVVSTPKLNTNEAFYPRAEIPQRELMERLENMVYSADVVTVTDEKGENPHSARVLGLYSPWMVSWDPVFRDDLVPLRDVFVNSAMIRDALLWILSRLDAGSYTALHLRIEEDFVYHAGQINVSWDYYTRMEVEGALDALESHNVPENSLLFVVSGVECSNKNVTSYLAPLQARYRLLCLDTVVPNYQDWAKMELFDRALVRSNLAVLSETFVGRFGSTFAAEVRRKRALQGRGGPDVDFEYAASHGFQHPDSYKFRTS